MCLGTVGGLEIRAIRLVIILIKFIFLSPQVSPSEEFICTLIVTVIPWRVGAVLEVGRSIRSPQNFIVPLTTLNYSHPTLKGVCAKTPESRLLRLHSLKLACFRCVVVIEVSLNFLSFEHCLWMERFAVIGVCTLFFIFAIWEFSPGSSAASSLRSLRNDSSIVFVVYNSTSRRGFIPDPGAWRRDSDEVREDGREYWGDGMFDGVEIGNVGVVAHLVRPVIREKLIEGLRSGSLNCGLNVISGALFGVQFRQGKGGLYLDWREWRRYFTFFRWCIGIVCDVLHLHFLTEMMVFWFDVCLFECFMRHGEGMLFLIEGRLGG